MWIWYLGLAGLAVCTPTLMLHDIRDHRLPNVWTFSLLGVAVVLAVLAGLDSHSLNHTVEPVVVSFAVVVTLLALNTAMRGGIGLGDIKLAAGTTIILALHDTRTAFYAISMAFIAAAVYSLWLMIARKAGGTRFAFGPFILMGTWIAALLVI